MQENFKNRKDESITLGKHEMNIYSLKFISFVRETNI